MEQEKPNVPTREIDSLVQTLSDTQVEKEASKRKIIVYQDKTHIPRVVEEILSNWEEQSQSKHFNAILTVAYKERVIAYYNEFKRQLDQQDYKMNIAMTFSFGNENDPDNVSREVMDTMFKDYSMFTGIEFVSGDKKKGEEAYSEDVVSRGTRGRSGRNEKNIDLIIVADKLLTGYDSKFLNTLYVDRSLELQGLIQAYSRTNRIYGKDKEFGTIINFKYPKTTEELVNTALKLYGSGGRSIKVIVDHYETAVRKLALDSQEMIGALADPTDWATLKTDDSAKELFIFLFKNANNQLRLVMQYYEFEWNDYTFTIDEHTWLKYVGAYRNLVSEGGGEYIEEPIIPLAGRTKLSGTQVIDANHILGLIGSKVKVDKGVQTVDRETLRIIHEEIQELSDMGQDEQAKLLKEFVDTELVKGNLSGNLDFDESFDKWKQEKIENEVGEFAKYWGIDEVLLSKSLGQFSITQKNVIPYITELQQSIDFNSAINKDAGNQLKHTMILLNKELPDWILKIKKKYKFPLGDIL